MSEQGLCPVFGTHAGTSVAVENSEKNKKIQPLNVSVYENDCDAIYLTLRARRKKYYNYDGFQTNKIQINWQRQTTVLQDDI